MIDPKALDAAFGQVLAKITALLGEGDAVMQASPAGQWTAKLCGGRATRARALAPG